MAQRYLMQLALSMTTTLCVLLAAAVAQAGGVIYMDEDFEGVVPFMDRNWYRTGDSAEPTTATIPQGVNLRRYSSDAKFTSPKVAMARQDGLLDGTRQFSGTQCYRLENGQALAVAPGQFPFRYGTGSRVWQFALSTGPFSASRPAGTKIGHFRIAYSTASSTSLDADTSIALEVRADGMGKAELICPNNGQVLGAVTGTTSSWLLVTVIAMNRINPGSLTDSVGQFICYDPLTGSYIGPHAGVSSGISIWAENSQTGQRGFTILKRGAELPTSWGNNGDLEVTSEISWEFATESVGRIYLDNLYWDCRTHENQDCGFDHERAARMTAFRTGVVLGGLFRDNAVLQRNRLLPIFGSGDPGDTVRVKLNGRSQSAIVQPDGFWKAYLPPMPEGGPYTLTAAGADSTATAQNIMLGEVWVGSGQSNMAFTTQEALRANQEIAAANHPNIRLFTVFNAAATRPVRFCTGNWDVCTSRMVPRFSAVQYFFGRDLQTSLSALSPNISVGLITSAFGGTRAESWISIDSIIAEFGSANPPNLKPSWGAIPNADLYDGMISPLTQFAIRGVNWYQGESNADTGFIYEQLLKLLIRDWRRNWNQGEFPFQIVQLPNMEGDWGGGPWMITREAQLLAHQRVKNTALAVTIDVGTANDVHPRNKQPVGYRLSQAAMHLAYGADNVPMGPLYRSMAVEGNQIRLFFDHTGDGLADRNGGNLQGFEIAGSDGTYFPANAALASQTILVGSPSVSQPAAARYAWDNNPPAVDLINSVGLPASPFRTDFPVAPSGSRPEWMLY